MPPSADNIATFVEVVRKQSLSGAARRLGLPKSTVSRRLSRLEQELGAQLLHRNVRRITLTSAGKGFFEAVSGPVDALESALLELNQVSQAPRGVVRLTAPPDLGRMLLSSMLVAFLERYPEIQLELLFTNRMLDLVQEGVDLAVRAGRSTGQELIARKLCDSELHLAASPKQAALIEQPKQLEKVPFVLYGAPGRDQTIRLERATGKRAQSVELEVSGRVSVDDYAALAELVAKGEGVGLMPAIHVHAGVEAGRLVRVLPEWASRTAHVYLVSTGRRQPERVRLLSEFLREEFARVAHV
ncbi:MAG: LysR family transcriptional regulator [Myxococcales bacterium]